MIRTSHKRSPAPPRRGRRRNSWVRPCRVDWAARFKARFEAPEVLPVVPAPPVDHLSETEVAELLNMDLDSMRKLADKRKMRVKMFGGQPRYNAFDVLYAMEDKALEESGGAGRVWLDREGWL